MLREQVITEWNHLRSLITTDQSYRWGQLLRRLDITSLAPDLTFEQVVQEIKTEQEREKIWSKGKLSDQVRTLKSSIRSLKIFLNTPHLKTLLHGTSELENIKHELEQEKEYINLLKNQINEIYLSDDEDGPRIEEVD